MNKYQKYILNKLYMTKDKDTFIFYRCCPIEKEGSYIKYGLYNEENDSFNITQDFDINIKKYVLIPNISNRSILISGILVKKKKTWTNIPLENGLYKILFDFDDPINAIKFKFINNLADDYILKITSTESDKKAYYAKKEEERLEQLKEKASIKISTGLSLVNIYFQPCCDEYSYTEILLYIPNEDTIIDNRGIKTIKKSWSLIKKNRVNKDEFYLSISGLAYGDYAFVLKQYGKSNKLLYETDYISFEIKDNSYHDIRPRVII